MVADMKGVLECRLAFIFFIATFRIKIDQPIPGHVQDIFKVSIQCMTMTK